MDFVTVMEEIDGVRPRLHVSALAAVANPSYQRNDTWNLLDDAWRHLAALDRAGRSTVAAEAAVRSLIDQLSAYERYWLFPGPARLATYRTQLDEMKTELLAVEVTQAVRFLAEYSHQAAPFDNKTPLASLTLTTKPQQRYTVLLADNSDSLSHNLAEDLRTLQRSSAPWRTGVATPCCRHC